MMHEKKSQSNNITLFIILFLVALLAYIWLKTKGFGYLDKVFDEILKPYINLLENIAIILVVLATTYLFIKFTSKIIRRYLEKRGRSKRNIKLLSTVYRYFVWIFAAFLTLSLLFKQIGSLITSVGLIGFGLTLALQKPILNFVGWLTIIFGKSYQIGDIISINNITGKVYDIKAMYTNLGELNQDGDSTGKSISIPNEYVLTTPVVNFTKGTNYIWDTITIHITYKSDWKKALKIVEKIIQGYYDKNIKPEVKKLFRETFKDYEKVITRVNLYEKGIIIKIRYTVDFDKSNDIKTELSKKILEQLKKYKTIILGKTENV
ncbi:MAG: mechanosensitive ion channel family protein [Nanoarchaeota archaeon]